MTLGISQVEGFSIGSLTETADGLSSGSEALESNATTVINSLDRVSTDWSGEAKTQAAVKAKDHADQINDRSKRWTDAAVVLRNAADQLGKLKDEIIATANDMIVRYVCDVADNGVATVKGSYLAMLADVYKDDPKGLATARHSAFSLAQKTSYKLVTLLNSMDVAAQYYDWTVESALLGYGIHPTGARPFVPRIPPPPAAPSGPIDDANRDGSGPAQYDTYKPNLLNQTYLQGLRAAAQSGALATSPALPIAGRLMRHFFGNSGKPYNFDVDTMRGDMPGFAGTADNDARRRANDALSVMPEGYHGPVAFQGAWNEGDKGFRPDATSHPDYWASLGTFAYQTSGVYMPEDGGNGTGPANITYQTSIYDYYNWDTTKKNYSEQYSDLNDLHRAGWAQNYQVYGTSGPSSVTVPQ
ncbi:hypothetical protein HUN08_10185 [Gordonia sp. X0973]|uniref:hypothetical protein n=1 Tax=Gordonia sp. X0973 TaxID=2742602 RepID=UPI000F524C0B|nr:hypothetical protein [Gordonia sp. X0973]QKT07516.1 hypothetical protein HUN08_10185 [Gordonia sp. X0973]